MNIGKPVKQSIVDGQIRRAQLSKEQKHEHRMFLRRQTGALTRADNQEINYMLAHGYHTEGSRIVPDGFHFDGRSIVHDGV